MSSDGLDRRYPSEVTRRSIIKTGTKIAYSAPLVAASISLGGRGAAAVPVVSPICTPDGVGCATSAECCADLFCNCTSFVCTQFGVLGTGACCTESRQCFSPLICGTNGLCCTDDGLGLEGSCP
jgi:hypothetical protein